MLKEKINENFTLIGKSSLDSKSRMTLGVQILKWLSDRNMPVDSLNIFVGEDGDILLRPLASIPSRELWLHNNPKAMASLQKGMRDVREGRITRVKKLAG